MGGRGSGRSGSMGMLVDKCEDYRSVDLAWLRRKGSLTRGYSSSITWSRGGSVTASIRYRVEGLGLRLIYRTRRSGDEWRDIDELFPFIYTATNFSGQRQWLQCLSCRKRCRILFWRRLFPLPSMPPAEIRIPIRTGMAGRHEPRAENSGAIWRLWIARRAVSRKTQGHALANL